MGFFSRLKDYNNLLEEILDRKTFPSIAKSLLLSMTYKLEIAYKDYEKVKVNCVTKEQFLDNILDIIKKYCDNIKTVEPESSQATLLEENNVEAVTNTKERSILTYPTEQAMLYAISDIEPKYFFIKKDFVFKNVLQKVLVEGYKQNTIEILKNFNGWSWEVNSNEKMNYTSNIIYQNIMMLKGEDFLYDWRMDNQARKDYLSDLKRSIKNITGNDNYYLSLCKLLYIIADKNEKSKITKELKIKEKEYQDIISKEAEKDKENSKNFNKLKNYQIILKSNNSEYEELVELQKQFLKIMEKKINRLTLHEEMVEILYQLRLYKNLVFYEGVLIKNYVEIQNMLEYVMKLAITKACKLGVIKIISMDIETNFEILNYILDTKIINLETIKIYLEIEDEDIFVKVYDKEIFEKQGKIKFDGKKKDIAIKRKKMIKIFN